MSFWDELFSAGESTGGGERVPMRLLRKGGRPLLLLPVEHRAAAASLELYPAQTTRARLAKGVLRWCLRAGLPMGTQKVSVTVPPEGQFMKFLSAVAETRSPNRIPCFGILAGNAATEGQRFLVLVFDSRLEPVAVVKAGLSDRARTLIQKEAAFLRSAPAETKGLPRLGATFESAHVQALSMAFFAGHSPGPSEEAGVQALLDSWVNRGVTAALGEMPDWKRLEKAALGSPWFASLVEQLRGRQVQATIHHGDFAPWNVKVSSEGVWTVLDWERGELMGIPGWDWFHYVLQPAILVRRLPVPGLVETIEGLLSSREFKHYSERAGIGGLARPLMLMYLLHSAEVIKPSEGLAATRELLEALRVRWAPELGA